jgi:hypothetical protein
MARYVAETLGESEKSKVVVENPLNADEVTIPFFWQPPAQLRERRPCGAAQNAIDFRRVARRRTAY